MGSRRIQEEDDHKKAREQTYREIRRQLKRHFADVTKVSSAEVTYQLTTLKHG